MPEAGLSESGEERRNGWVSRQVRALVSAWEKGDRLTAREVIDRHPDLDPESALRLIYEETCLRREAGEPLLHRAQQAGVVREDVTIGELIQLVVGIVKIPTAEPEQVQRILRVALDGLRYQQA